MSEYLILSNNSNFSIKCPNYQTISSIKYKSLLLVIKELLDGIFDKPLDEFHERVY